MAKKQKKKTQLPIVIVLGVVFIILCWFIQDRFFPNGTAMNKPTGDTPMVANIDVANTIRVTEVMTSNASIIQDETGAYADWIEVTNVSSGDVNLYGWKLAKDFSYRLKYFEFPNHTLKPGERVIVFCTSTVRNNYGYVYHAPFKLSASGDTLILYNDAGTAVQALNIPEMPANSSYAEINGKWTVTDKPTPLLENIEANYEEVIANRRTVESPISVTEFMAKNVSYVPYGSNKEYHDWIEIHNSSSSSINLAGYSLSDTMDNPRKWSFPSISIGPGEYLLVYCSGYDRKDADGTLHTNFKLSTEKESVVLSDSNGNLIDIIEYDLLKADQSYARQTDGTWTTNKAPTPGLANTFSSAALISGQFAAQNSSMVFINEVMASTSTANVSGASYDWVELRNAGSQSMNLSGWGLSDDPSKPRKWQFPEGTVIAAGQYMGVYLSGLDGKVGSYLHTNFSLSSTAGETLVLSTPEGVIVDRCPLGTQYSNVAYGRMGDRNGFYYLTGATPGSVNVTSGYESKMSKPVFSEQGGMFAAGTVINLSMACEDGATIYYTLDSSTPDPTNMGGRNFTPDPRVNVKTHTQTYKYTGPITISGTTVVRAISVKEGQLPSMVNTQTYFMGVNHTMQVVSLVMDPADLWDYNKGIYVMGPNATASSPYGSLNKGANFWMTWEKAANIELFGLDGKTILTQGCGVRLHGQYSRKEDQKAFKVIARSAYGQNRFNAPLFPNRDYTEYQSFLLRASGQDVDKTRMRDSVLSALAEGMDVMYQDTDLCIVYLNGEYWGQYNMRERINSFSICQWEGWDTAMKDSIDLLKANTNVMQGSNNSWIAIRDWVNKNGVETDDKLAYVEQYVDVWNYLNYCAVEIYTGNTDLLNCKKYRCEQIDGKWRWVLYDFDWAFTTDTNSPRRWLTAGGVGEGNKYDNAFFIALMKNSKCKDYFLKLFAEKLRTNWSSEAVVGVIRGRYDVLEPEIDQHLAKWNISRSQYESSIKSFVSYANKRPGRLLYFYSNVLSKSEFEYYFGDIAAKVNLIDDKGNSYAYKR